MASTATATKNNITLRGSVRIVTEFFGYSVNSILYQRGIYPPDTFKRVNKYGLQMLVTTDEALNKYLGNVLRQLSLWLLEGSLQKLVLVVSSVEKKKVIERWSFDIDCDKSINEDSKPVDRLEDDVMHEIQAITSVTYLPLLQEACTFDLLVYTDKDAEVPREWEHSDPRYITNAQDVRLRSFTTKIHKVDTTVSYAAQ